MSHILKNKNLEIQIDLPAENYNFSRFDWTGNIVSVKFKNIQLASTESITYENEMQNGKGFYNEFGIDTALGFNEAVIGDWFHKIGVGLLKKDNEEYIFNRNYEIKPADFEIKYTSNTILITCKSEFNNGYSYVLKKEIKLEKHGFTINYDLENTGEKEIITDEYVHNFIAINKEIIGRNYVLKFPFKLMPAFFLETVNPEQKVTIGQTDVTFNDSPKEQFFFSNLTGYKNVKPQWELKNLESKISISETGSFHTNKVNLWGWKHVISPELFIDISIKPGQNANWTRDYKISNFI
jgi:hypothetical protein|tara:strand:- start:5885 stop:6769 length:885 start_codon:yes stop_codon:yes gene_type:complete